MFGGIGRLARRAAFAAALIGAAVVSRPAMATYIFATIDDPVATSEDTVVSGVTAQGELVGYYKSGVHTYGFTDTGGVFTTVTVPFVDAAGYSTLVTGVNGGGTLVGYYSSSTGLHGFTDTGGTFSTIDDPTATAGTLAQGINSAGQVVGYVNTSLPSGGFLDSAGTFTAITDPSASSLTRALAINSSDQIVGYYYQSGTGSTAHAFIDDGGTFDEIIDPGAIGGVFAQGINDAGAIVGRAGNDAFLYYGGIFLTIDVPGATTTSANAIGADGTIVGSYTDATGTHGFEATSVPEPGTAILLTTGVIGLLMAKSRKRLG